ncbi:phospholipase D family protein [bacterium]|nr:phospholipase D family protein [bacterium]
MNKDFRFVDSGWDSVLNEALQRNHARLRIVCPFIKRRTTERLLRLGKPDFFQVITRYNLRDFYDSISDTEALRLLIENGAQIRCVRNLHAKLYLFDEHRVIVTSANLTEAALLKNHEFGFVSEDSDILDYCLKYFNNLWGRVGPDITNERLSKTEEILSKSLVGGSRLSQIAGLGDEGVDAGISIPPLVLPPWQEDVIQSFVKFFGEGDKRSDRSRSVLDEVRRSGCHWACTYPKGKRPRQVKDGAVMFMGRLVKEPSDILIYGRAVAMSYQEVRDDASAADIKIRDWKEKWPHYIRMHHTEFLAGSLAAGVSLNKLMDELKSDAFASTQRNLKKGEGNTDPRKAYMQQAAVELSHQGIAWLNAKLESAFAEHGRLAPAVIDQLDWPEIEGVTQRGSKERDENE